jgi:flagellar biosynthesis/type III secretory pathway chaperone
MNNQPHQHPKQSLREAAAVCQQLKSLVAEENDALESRQIDRVEENIKQKTQLTLKLETLLNRAKAQKDLLKEDPHARNAAKHVQGEMESFQTLARQNMLLLKAAHQTRADTLQMIRQALSEKNARVETYNAQGQVGTKGKDVNLVNKAV